MPSENYPHIAHNESGVPCIDGTRHRVVDIAADYIAHGYSADQIVEQYPDLTPAQVHGAFTYYFDHRDEIDRVLMGNYQKTEQWRKAQPLHPKILAVLAKQVV